jgi:hypothetical protein
MRHADRDHAAADEHDACQFDQRRMLVQEKDCAERGEERSGAARDGIDGGESGTLVGFHQQQFVERVHESRRDQEPDCGAFGQRDKKQHGRDENGGEDADQESHGIFVLGALGQHVDDGMNDGGNEDQDEGEAHAATL